MEKYFCYSNRHSCIVEVARPFTDINLHRLLKLERKHATTMNIKLCFGKSDEYNTHCELYRGDGFDTACGITHCTFLLSIVQNLPNGLACMYSVYSGKCQLCARPRQ